MQPVYRRRRAPSKLDEFKPLIDQWLAKRPRLLATRIHQDLVRDYGFWGSYNTVRRYVERARPRPEPRQEERFETRPGHQAQVDWSHEQPVRTGSGLELPLYCFHMVLGHSRDSFCAFTGSQDLVTFWACHRAAFDHFGGVPRELLYDRTKTVVRQHVGREVRLGERLYHPEALASAHHYGFKLRLCRPYRPKTKGKVESDVPYVRERLLHGHGFTSHEQAKRRLALLERGRGAPTGARHSRRGCRRARRARPGGASGGAPDSVSGRRAHQLGDRPRRVLQLRRSPLPRRRRQARRARLAGARRARLEVYSTIDGRRLARHERGRPARILPDPVEDSVSLAQVLAALPQPEVHRRPLSVYEEAAGG